jgi:hypothetical protein
MSVAIGESATDRAAALRDAHAHNVHFEPLPDRWQRSSDDDRSREVEAGKPSLTAHGTPSGEAQHKPQNQREPDKDRSGNMQTGKPKAK